DPPGGAAAVPADPDDDAGGAVRRDPDDARIRLGRGAAPAAGPGDGGRPAGEPGAHPVHHAGDLPVLRPAVPSPPDGARRGGAGALMERGRFNLSRPFIERPVATILLAVAVVLSGILAYRMLPVAPLPQVDYPAIQVSASMPGAS